MRSTVRGRLTLATVTGYGLILILISVGTYILVARAQQHQREVTLRAFGDAADRSLHRETQEGESIQQAATSTVVELNFPPEQSIAIFTADGALLASHGTAVPPFLDPSRVEEHRHAGLAGLVSAVAEAQDEHAEQVIARTVTIADRRYVFVLRQTNTRTAPELESLRRALLVAVPAGLVMSALAGWLVTRRMLRPLEMMAAQAQAIGADTLDDRLHVPNPTDEVGRLGSSFNALLDRLTAAFALQRRFMADASHELRTPLSVISSAAEITLDRPRRPEQEYRESRTPSSSRSPTTPAARLSCTCRSSRRNATSWSAEPCRGRFSL